MTPRQAYSLGWRGGMALLIVVNNILIFIYGGQMQEVRASWVNGLTIAIALGVLVDAGWRMP